MAVSQAAGELQVALTDLDRARKSIERALKQMKQKTGEIPEPRWRMQYRRQWKLLNEVRDAGGDLHWTEWRDLGAANGYKPSAMGGFFNGVGTMEKDDERRRLSKTGEKFLDEYEPMFGGGK
jgi:hypothetical protein